MTNLEKKSKDFVYSFFFGRLESGVSSLRRLI